MARVNPTDFRCPWGQAERCPCGSEEPFIDCCRVGNHGIPYISLPSIQPPGGQTGYQHPKCYLAGSRNCSEGKSREHYVSEGILSRFDKLRVSGMPWQPKGEVAEYPANALAANILCERHNNALAPIDTLGLKAFDALTSACDYALEQKTQGRVRHFLISGEALELWMLKLSAGIHFGGIAAFDGAPLRDNYGFPMIELEVGLANGALPRSSHMWVTQNVGVVERAHIGVSPLIDTTSNQQTGVAVQFGPLKFEAVIIDPPITSQHFRQLEQRRRPRIIDFVGPARDARVVLSWPGQPLIKANRLAIQVAP